MLLHNNLDANGELDKLINGGVCQLTSSLQLLIYQLYSRSITFTEGMKIFKSDLL